jgi:hypothetical protein
MDLSVLAAYTFSKSIDDTSAFEPVTTDQNFPQNSYDYRAERALSSFDMAQRAVAAYVYMLPFHNRWLRNFENSSIITAAVGPAVHSDAGVRQQQHRKHRRRGQRL